MATITLKVSGMKCGGCENAVRDAAKALGGVSEVKASHKEGTVQVEYDPGRTDENAIKQASRISTEPRGAGDPATGRPNGYHPPTTCKVTR
jgi:copper chaperone